MFLCFTGEEVDRNRPQEEIIEEEESRPPKSIDEMLANLDEENKEEDGPSTLSADAQLFLRLYHRIRAEEQIKESSSTNYQG
jgi:hypothetical protein